MTLHGGYVSLAGFLCCFSKFRSWISLKVLLLGFHDVPNSVNTLLNVKMYDCGDGLP